MRQRITGPTDDRTKILAAISHDLYTPITRMRLRSAFIEDETSRRMLADLDQMQSNAGFWLGLAIARAIALAHGGELTLHDRSPRGLVVRIDIPLRLANTQNAA